MYRPGTLVTRGLEVVDQRRTSWRSGVSRFTTQQEVLWPTVMLGSTCLVVSCWCAAFVSNIARSRTWPRKWASHDDALTSGSAASMPRAQPACRTDRAGRARARAEPPLESSSGCSRLAGSIAATRSGWPTTRVCRPRPVDGSCAAMACPGWLTATRSPGR